MLEAKPLVSVIMNCYNGEKYLRAAIDSVYVQTYKDWEIIFWDNASTDNSAAIANSYDSKLRYFNGKETLKLGAARNKALEKCGGEYIAFLDVDDLWLSKKLELQIQKILDDPEAIVCYSDGYEIVGEEKTKKRFSSYPNVKFYEGEIFNKLILSNFINWQTVLINKTLSGDRLYFNEELTLSEDHEILLKLSLCGKIILLKEPLIYYRLHENNMSHDYDLMLQESTKIIELFDRDILNRKINTNAIKSLIYGSIVIRMIKISASFNKYSKFLIKYPNFQNVIIYCIIKLGLTPLLQFYFGLKSRSKQK